MIQVQRLSCFTKPASHMLEEYYAAIGVLLRDPTSEMERLIADPHSAMWLAEVNGEPGGCVVFRRGVPTPEAGECKRLYVKPVYREKGLANRLMNCLEQFAREEQVSCIYLDTNHAFQASVSLYKRRGYLPCERYNDNPQADLFYRKTIHALRAVGENCHCAE